MIVRPLSAVVLSEQWADFVVKPGREGRLCAVRVQICQTFRFGLIGMFGISEPGRDISPSLTGSATTTDSAHLTKQQFNFFYFAQEIILST